MLYQLNWPGALEIGEFGEYVWNLFLLMEIAQDVFFHPPGKYLLTLYYATHTATGLGIH